MIERKKMLLYAVTDRAFAGKLSFYEQIEEALKGGVTLLQLREKEISDEEFAKEATEVLKICRKYGVPLIINDNLKVALKVGADGIHVGQNDLCAAEIRKKTGGGFIIGVTAKTTEQAIKAEKDGADYIGVGAVFPSPTKKDAVRITSKELEMICKSVSIPAVAIGGISAENVLSLKGCGIAGAAVVSGIFSMNNIEKSAENLKRLLGKVVEHD